MLRNPTVAYPKDWVVVQFEMPAARVALGSTFSNKGCAASGNRICLNPTLKGKDYNMKCQQFATLLQLGFALAVSANAQDAVQQQLSVAANMDIYRAAGFDDGSDGVAPVDYSFSAGTRKILEFSSVTGTWTCDVSTPFFGPDGSTTFGPGCRPPIYIAKPIGTFSQYYGTDYMGAMVGMFLEDTSSTIIAPIGHFYSYDYLEGGIKTNFAALAPDLGQVFFIGDGLTGTGTGRTQAFIVPATATHLYLGFVDTCANLLPGCYSDNSGTLTATLKLYR
jgi:hypothetical protein